MSIARRGVVAGLIGTLGGCSSVGATLLDVTVSRDGYSRNADIPYGPLPRQKLDFYRPKEPRADSKTVIFFYGGAWDHGEKGHYLFVGQALAARGITVVIADYRVFPQARFPAFIDDAALAVRWTADRVGTDKLFVMGHSAGAHLALMLGANTPYLAMAGVDRMKLRGIIGLSGPYDFLPLTSPRLIEIFGGPDRIEILPITFATAPLPPLLLIHGGEDRTVRAANSERLAAAWAAAGGSVELKIYPEANHVDVAGAFAELLRSHAPTLADVSAFIDAH